MTQAATSSRIPKPRPAPSTTKAGDVPRHWFLGLPFPSHMSNGVNMLFPAGERFFVRSVRHFEHLIQDPVLKAQIKGFYGQEGRHAKAHEDVIQLLRDQGYDVDRFLRFYEFLGIQVMERLCSPELRLASTAAAEHFTAIMAEGALIHRFFDDAHPAMRDLFCWHAAEEIEHKAVAFDVLKQVAPSYPLRMAGLALATVTLSGFWALGTASLLAQEEASLRKMLRDSREARQSDRSLLRDVFLAGILEYARPDFHPNDRDNGGLADAYLSELPTVAGSN